MDYKPRYLVMVTANNNNKYYKQIPISATEWKAEYGRVGSAPQTARYSMSQWDKKYNEKIRKGYVDKTELIEDAIVKTEVKNPSDDFKTIENKAIADIVNELQMMATNAIRQNYTVNSEAVTQMMVDEAQTIIDNLMSRKTIISFNKDLLDLFQVIPRAMSDVKKHLANSKDDFANIIKREQDLLDVMRGQVIQNQVVSDAEEDKNTQKSDKTILEHLGLVFEECTPEDIARIKVCLGSCVDNFNRAWKVTNCQTQEQYDKFIEENNIKETKLLFHGSRNENWWSIICNGLKLRPSNAIITGKLYGMGTYFAPKAKKSLGYTSLRGSYWANGNATKGYMALMEVAYGTPYDVYDFDSKYHDLNYDKLQKFKKGANCLHAHAGANIGYTSLKNDEIVIYKEEQCTIKYLVELT